MKKILFCLFIIVSFFESTIEAAEKSIEAKLIVGKTLNLTLKDQFNKNHTVNSDTKRVIFSFSKASTYICNNFFVTKPATYLQNHHAYFISDISSVPSFLRTIFIMPDIREFKHTVLLLDDDNLAASFQKGIDTKKIIVVYVLNKKIFKIKTISTQEELKESLEMAIDKTCFSR